MWWPCFGGLIIGIGGYIFPQGFGVGYEYIAALLQSDLPIKVVLGILFVKSLMWALSLGSGTSGGVLAPLLMVGGALGAAATHFFPAVFPFEGGGFWAAISMAAVLGATLGIPLTALIFAIELTQDLNMLLPLLLATVVAYALNILVMRRSILTEKISRRGFHLSREYAVDPLEIMFVREAMRTSILALPRTISTLELRASLSNDHVRRGQWLYPIVDEHQILHGVVTRNELQKIAAECAAGQINVELGELCTPQRKLVVAYPDEPLRIIVNRMAESGLTRFPVVDRRSTDRQHGSPLETGHVVGPRLVGLVSITDLLKARVANLHAEHKRQRVIPVRVFLPARFRSIGSSSQD
jgi:chloride channel protein, CIC family